VSDLLEKRRGPGGRMGDAPAAGSTSPKLTAKELLARVGHAHCLHPLLCWRYCTLLSHLCVTAPLVWWIEWNGLLSVLSSLTLTNPISPVLALPPSTPARRHACWLFDRRCDHTAASTRGSPCCLSNRLLQQSDFNFHLWSKYEMASDAE
jgi:hypothetical protein